MFVLNKTMATTHVGVHCEHTHLYPSPAIYSYIFVLGCPNPRSAAPLPQGELR